MKFYNLQLLRFFAATAVIFYHGFRMQPRINFFIEKGNFAVGMFFVLSGFVISNSLISKPMRFKIYFRKRVQKIFPLWIFSVILKICITGKPTVSFFRIVIAVALLQSIYPNFSLDLNFVGWSLSIEFIMYLLMYLVMMRFDIFSKWFEIVTWMVWLLTQIAFIYCLKTGFGNNNLPFDHNKFLFYNPIWHINEFLFGMLLTQKLSRNYNAKFFTYKYATFITVIAYLFILCLSFVAGYKCGISHFYNDGFLAPVTAVFIFFLVVIEKKRAPVQAASSHKNRLFDLLGGISFGMYLFHKPLIYLVNSFIEVHHNIFLFMGYYLIVIGFSYVAYRVIELGFIRIGNRLAAAASTKKRLV